MYCNCSSHTILASCIHNSCCSMLCTQRLLPVVAFFLYCSSCNRIGEIKAFIPTVSSTTHPSTRFSLSAKTNNFLIPTKQFDMTSQSAIASAAITQRLYPASMIGTLGEAYFRMTKEMACPRGVVRELLLYTCWYLFIHYANIRLLFSRQ